MNRTALNSSALGILAAIATSQAAADSANVASLPVAGQFSVTPNAGTSFNVGGDFVKSGSQSINNTALFGATVTGVTTFSVNSKDFNDVYDLPLQIGVAGNYGLTNEDEVSAGLRYMHADGKSFGALNTSSAGTIGGVAFAGSATFQGKFSNYDEVGLDGGYKHFFDVSSSFHPYLGGSLGVSHTNSISLDLSYNGTPIINGMKFYQSGWDWSAGLQAGFRYDVAASVALGLETGVRYTGDLRSDSSDINPGSAGGLAHVNSGGNRWDIPLLAGLTVKF